MYSRVRILTIISLGKHIVPQLSRDLLRPWGSAPSGHIRKKSVQRVREALVASVNEASTHN